MLFILLVGLLVARSNGQYWLSNDYVYEYYYPQVVTYPVYAQTQQVYPNYNQRVYQQTSPSVSVAEAEWICTNQRTQDTMIIASEDIPGSRINNGQGQRQYYPKGTNQPIYPQFGNPESQGTNQQIPNNQPNYPQPQQPINPPTEPPRTTTTTEEPRPIWPNPGNDNRPVPSYTTTERSPGPIWSNGGSNNQQRPTYTTTSKPTRPVWTGDDTKPGFTVVLPTPKPQSPIQGLPNIVDPMWPDYKPPSKSQKTTTLGPPDDDSPIEIVMGKK